MGKRTELMIAEDRAKVCELLRRGYTSKAEMAAIINSGRDPEHHISRAQVAKDIEWMENQYIERGLEDLAVAKHKAKDRLLYLMKTYYEGYEASKETEISIEDEDIVGEEVYDEILYAADGGETIETISKKVKTKRKFRKEGNVAFLNGVKACIDSIAKIDSADGATKVSLTDPTGTESVGALEFLKFQIDELAENKEFDLDFTQKLLGSGEEEPVNEEG